jgi:DNA-binding FrmR family transcriptional regulator
LEDLSRDQLELIESAEEAKKKLMQRLWKYKIYVDEHSYLFSKDVKVRLERVRGSAEHIVGMAEGGKTFEQIDQAMTDFYEQLDAIEDEFRNLVDSHILENATTTEIPDSGSASMNADR